MLPMSSKGWLRFLSLGPLLPQTRCRHGITDVTIVHPACSILVSATFADIILFKWWVPLSNGAYAASCIAVLLMGVLVQVRAVKCTVLGTVAYGTCLCHLCSRG